MTGLARRDFLRFRKRSEDRPLPPYALPQADLQTLCDGCDACITACPESVIDFSDISRTPVVDFTRGECTLCGECAKACPNGAMAGAEEPTWTVKATILPDCLSYRSISCRSCADSCEWSAIRFKLALGGKQLPILDEDACTGCGACFNTCPNHSIQMREQTAPMEVK